MAVRENNQLREWLIFFLYGIQETAFNSIQVFKDIISLKQNIESNVISQFSAPRQKNVHMLIKALYKHPVVDIKGAALLLEVKINTASSIIKELVAMDVLQEMTGKQRNRVFMLKEYIMIFK